jgi:hypothetical protein
MRIAAHPHFFYYFVHISDCVSPLAPGGSDYQIMKEAE